MTKKIRSPRISLVSGTDVAGPNPEVELGPGPIPTAVSLPETETPMSARVVTADPRVEIKSPKAATAKAKAEINLGL